MSTKRANIFITKAGYAALLQEELKERWGLESQLLSEDAVAIEERQPTPHFEQTVFARQFLPLAHAIESDDIQHTIDSIIHTLKTVSQRANRQTGRWTLHSFALEDNASNHHAVKLAKQLLPKIQEGLPRFHKRFIAADELVKQPLQPKDFVIQLYVASPSLVWLSISSFTTGISPFIGGTLRMRARSGSPSRSARKLEEAFYALGRVPQAHETAVDLGAAPGGWTFSLARRGTHVTAVDGTDLALPPNKALIERVDHVRENGLRYHPSTPVDWMCCDMIVPFHETLRVLSSWLDKQLMKHFIVNLKLPKNEPWAAIQEALTLFESHKWPVMTARHLFHDRWEVTLIGSKQLTAPKIVLEPQQIKPSTGSHTASRATKSSDATSQLSL